MFKILVIGAVTSTAATIKALVRHRFSVEGILGLEPIKKERVSGWYDLQSLAQDYKIDYKGFRQINEPEIIGWARAKKPDIIFAVGFSQLLNEEWIAMPGLGCIGFHPTSLPQGRGRAPIAWIILEERKGAASFFLLGNGIDNGPVFIQKEFFLENDDDASSVEAKILDSIDTALDSWLPELRKGIWDPKPQNETLATWYGKRDPADGLINWHLDADEIDKLIKASSKPHPGAYTYFKHQKLIIWASEVEKSIPIKGVVGRILLKKESGNFLIQCGSGLIWIKKLEMQEVCDLKAGDKLGYIIEDELYKIWEVLNRLSDNE